MRACRVISARCLWRHVHRAHHRILAPRAFLARTLTQRSGALDDDVDANEDKFEMPAPSPPPSQSQSDADGDTRSSSLFSSLNDSDRRQSLQSLASLPNLHATLYTATELLLRHSDALTPRNYSYIIRTLYKHAGFDRTNHLTVLDDNETDAFCQVLMAVWECACANEWQLSTSSYNCIIYVLANFNHSGATVIYEALRGVNTVILDDVSYGPLIAMAMRQRDYARVIQLWRDMHQRYSLMRRVFNQSESALRKQYRWDEDKVRELSYLAMNVPCQRLWMYHAVLKSAQKLNRTRFVGSIIRQLHRWQQLCDAAQQVDDSESASVRDSSIGDNDEHRSVDSETGSTESAADTNTAADADADSEPSVLDTLDVSQRYTAPHLTPLSYKLLLTHYANINDWHSVLDTVKQMMDTHQPFNPGVIEPIVRQCVEHQQWEQLLSLTNYLTTHQQLFRHVNLRPVVLIIKGLLGRSQRELVRNRQHFLSDLTAKQWKRYLNWIVRQLASDRIIVHDASNQSLLVRLSPQSHSQRYELLYLSLLYASLHHRAVLVEADDAEALAAIANDCNTQYGIHLQLFINGAFVQKHEDASVASESTAAILERWRTVNTASSDNGSALGDQTIRLVNLAYVSHDQIIKQFPPKMQSIDPTPPSPVQRLFEIVLAYRYHRQWSSLMTIASPLSSHPILSEFLNVWSLQSPSPSSLTGMLPSSGFDVLYRPVFAELRAKRIYQAMRAVAATVALPAQLALDTAIENSPAVGDELAPVTRRMVLPNEGTLMDFSTLSLTNSYALLYLYLQYIMHCAGTTIYPVHGALYIHDKNDSKLESVRSFLWQHFRLPAFYLASPASLSKRNSARCETNESSESESSLVADSPIPTPLPAHRAGHPAAYRKLKLGRLNGKFLTPQQKKNELDLTFALVVRAEDLQRWTVEGARTDHTTIGVEVAKQYERERPTQTQMGAQQSRSANSARATAATMPAKAATASERLQARV